MKLNLRSGLWVGAMSHKRSCESIFRLSRCGGICFLVPGGPIHLRFVRSPGNPETPWWDPTPGHPVIWFVPRKKSFAQKNRRSISNQRNWVFGSLAGSMFQLRPSLWIRHLGWKGTRTMQAWRPNGRRIGGLKLHFGDAASKLSDLWGNRFLCFFCEIRGIVLKKYIFNDSLDVFGCLRYCGKRNYGYPFFWDPEEIQRTTWIA